MISQLLIHAKGSWRDYFELCKPKVVGLIIFTAMVGMLLASPSMVPLDLFIYASIGIGLAASSAACINHIIDHQIDSVMARTAKRPLPQGNLNIIHALLFACMLGVLSMLILIYLVNLLTALLTAASLIGYGIIYSMFLKRATPQNIVIGGAAGATPPILGWTAITGSLDPQSLLLFLIVFVWTPPHFWSLAIYRRNEYTSANIPMLPVTHGVAFTRLHILLYTILLCIVSTLPFMTKMSGIFYLLSITGLNLNFLYFVIRMQFDHSDRLAMQTFSYSVIYLMLLFAVLLIDHYIPYIVK